MVGRGGGGGGQPAGKRQVCDVDVKKTSFPLLRNFHFLSYALVSDGKINRSRETW